MAGVTGAITKSKAASIATADIGLVLTVVLLTTLGVLRRGSVRAFIGTGGRGLVWSIEIASGVIALGWIPFVLAGFTANPIEDGAVVAIFVLLGLIFRNAIVPAVSEARRGPPENGRNAGHGALSHYEC